MRAAVLLVVLVLPGLAGALAFGFCALRDYELLIPAMARLQAASGRGDWQAVLVADAMQNVHRINVFAEGIWSLLCAIYLAIGLAALLRGPSQANGRIAAEVGKP